jgi:hypothetical protein
VDFLNQGVALVEVTPSNSGKDMIGTAWFDMLTMTMSHPDPFDRVILSLSKDDMLLRTGLSKDEFPLYES